MRQHPLRALGLTWRIAALAIVLGAALAPDLALAAGILSGRTRPGFGQEPSSPAWARLRGPASPVTRLFAPASGALLAGAVGELSRTDDGGRAWRAVALAP